MNTNLRRAAWAVMFAAMAAFLWFALFRRADAPHVVPAAQSAAQASVPALAPRKAVVPTIAKQMRAPDLPAHELPEWDAPLEESVSELRKWSDAGDADAQRQLTDRLELCSPHGLKEAKKFDETEHWNIERDAQNPKISDEVPASNHEFFQSHIDRNEKIREACTRLPKDLLDHWLDPADRAAQAGNVMAMLTYAKAALADYDDIASIAANIDEVVERRDKARVYLEEAARRGNERALVMLAQAHADTQIAFAESSLYAKDPSAAYAYAFVASRNADGTSGDQKNMEWIMLQSAKKLDAEALARASRRRTPLRAMLHRTLKAHCATAASTL